MQIPEHAYTVILAGGGGTRLWPKSRQKHPKHLLKLFGDQTLLQLTFSRLNSFIPEDRIFVITHHDHLEEAQQQLPLMEKENWIVEPEAKNTAVAMAVAATYVYHQDPQAVILNCYADHLIPDQESFTEAAVATIEAATQNRNNLITLGIKPKFAHTGLGYIKFGQPVKSVEVGGKRVEVMEGLGFKEKPDLETANVFLKEGNYLWNAGYYCWSAMALLDALKTHHPSLYQTAQDYFAYLEHNHGDLGQIYSSAESVQIDYAVSEKAQNILVIAGDFEWSDIGDWKVVYDTSEHNAEGNAVVGDSNKFIGIDNKNCLIETNGRLIAAIGLEDIVIVDTKDVVLICKKDRSQDVKRLVEELKKLERKDLL